MNISNSPQNLWHQQKCEVVSVEEQVSYILFKDYKDKQSYYLE